MVLSWKNTVTLTKCYGVYTNISILIASFTLNSCGAVAGVPFLKSQLKLVVRRIMLNPRKRSMVYLLREPSEKEEYYKADVDLRHLKGRNVPTEVNE
jgi:hypothetical protein